MTPKYNDSKQPRRGVRGVLAGIAAAAALIASPTVANAASTVYAPEQGARTFADGLSGWTETSESDGLCVELVLCPQIDNTHEAGGGADENGFIRTAISSLTGAGGTTTGIWSSPTFVYDGNGGVRPDTLELSLARRADVSDLLRVDDNTAGFTVNLVSVSSPQDTVTVIDERSLAGADDWSRVRDIAIDPSQVKVGDKYRIEIATTYNTGITVVPGGSADYDDVVMRARGVADGADGANGADGQNGGNGGGNGGGSGDGNGAGGAGGGASADDALAGSGIAGGAATLTKSGKLKVKVKCSRRAESKCKQKLTGLLSKKGAKLGKARKVSLKAGKKRVVALKVKASLRPKLSGQKRVFVRQKVTIAGKSKTKVVKLKLRHG